MRQAKRCAVLLIAAGLNVASTVCSAGPVVKLAGSTSARLCTDCPRDIRFAVLPGVKPADGESPEILEAAIGGQRDAAIAPSFSAKWDPAGGEARALIVNVNKDLVRQGTYEVLINPLPKSNPAADPVKVQILVPTAKLQVPDKISVGRTVYYLIGNDEIDATPITVRETGGLSAIKALDIDAQPSTQGAIRVSGRLSGPNEGPIARVQVKAGDRKDIPIHLAGRFPLGTVTSQVRLSAPELAEALTIPVEVTSRLPLLYAAIAIVLGFMLSYFVKVYLHDRLALGQARIAAAEIISKVTTDMSRRQDSEFAKKLADPLSNLKKEVTNDDITGMEKARTALDTEWAGALKDLETRLQSASKSLDDCRRVVAKPWELAEPMATTIRDARDALKTVETAIHSSNAIGAEKALGESRDKLADTIPRRGAEWQGAIRRFIGAIEKQQRGISAAVSSALSERFTKWTAEATTIDASIPNRTFENLEKTLNALDREYAFCRDLLRQAAENIQIESDQVIAELQGHIGDQDLRDLKDATTALVMTLQTAVDNVDQAGHVLTDQSLRLDACLRKAISPEKADAKVEEALNARKFQEAARQAVIASPERDAILGRVEADGATEQLSFLPPAMRSVSADRMGSPMVFGGLSIERDPYTALLVQSKGSVRSAKAAQTLIVAVLFCVWAISAWSESFLGTWPSVVTLFFTAFGSDMAVDAMLERMKGK